MTNYHREIQSSRKVRKQHLGDTSDRALPREGEPHGSEDLNLDPIRGVYASRTASSINHTLPAPHFAVVVFWPEEIPLDEREATRSPDPFIRIPVSPHSIYYRLEKTREAGAHSSPR